jgi:hypothetical protein
VGSARSGLAVRGRGRQATHAILSALQFRVRLGLLAAPSFFWARKSAVQRVQP